MPQSRIKAAEDLHQLKASRGRTSLGAARCIQDAARQCNWADCEQMSRSISPSRSGTYQPVTMKLAKMFAPSATTGTQRFWGGVFRCTVNHG